MSWLRDEALNDTLKNWIKILQAIQEHKSRNSFQEHEPNRTSTSNSNRLKQEPMTNYWLETFNSNIWPIENQEQETKHVLEFLI